MGLSYSVDKSATLRYRSATLFMEHCMKRPLAAFCALALLAACAERNSQNQYSASEVGVAKTIQFGTVISVREVGITGENSGTGTLIGGATGAGLGSYVGNGSGRGWAMAGAAIAGAVAGHYAEQEMNDRTGVEYTVATEKGETKIIVQELKEGERVLGNGERVVIQTCSGESEMTRCADGYERVLPASALPTQMQRPQGIKMVD